MEPELGNVESKESTKPVEECDKSSLDDVLYEPLPRPRKAEGVVKITRHPRKSGRIDGALQCLPLRDADGLRFVSCLDAAKELAKCMHEPKYNVLNNTIKQIGLDKTIELFHETCQIQEQGGVMSNEGSVKKAPGGVFFALLKKCASQDQLRTIFHVEKVKRRKRLQAKKQKKKKLDESRMVCSDSEPPAGDHVVQSGHIRETGGTSSNGDREEGEVDETKETVADKEESGGCDSEMMDVDQHQLLLADLEERKAALAAAQKFERTDSLNYGQLLSLD